MPVWAYCKGDLIDKAQVIQNEAARVCQKKVGSREHTTPLLNNMGWLSIKNMATYMDILQLKSIRQFSAPKDLA